MTRGAADWWVGGVGALRWVLGVSIFQTEPVSGWGWGGCFEKGCGWGGLGITKLLWGCLCELTTLMPGTGFRFFCEGPVFLVEALLPRVMLVGTSHSIGNAGITHRARDFTQVCVNRLLGGTLTCP